jgi:hypothetical protein
MVYIKFGGSSQEKAVRSGVTAVESLDGKTFDERPISANFISENAFNQKLMER